MPIACTQHASMTICQNGNMTNNQLAKHQNAKIGFMQHAYWKHNQCQNATTDKMSK